MAPEKRRPPSPTPEELFGDDPDADRPDEEDAPTEVWTSAPEMPPVEETPAPAPLPLRPATTGPFQVESPSGAPPPIPDEEGDEPEDEDDDAAEEAAIEGAAAPSRLSAILVLDKMLGEGTPRDAAGLLPFEELAAEEATLHDLVPKGARELVEEDDDFEIDIHVYPLTVPRSALPSSAATPAPPVTRASTPTPVRAIPSTPVVAPAPALAPAPDVPEIFASVPDAGAAPPVVPAVPALAPQARRGRSIFSGADLHQRFQDHIHHDNDLDAAFCVADALVFMGKAKEGVRLFHEHHRPVILQRTQRVIDDSLWRTLVQTPGEDQQISALMAAISGTVAGSMARKPKALGLEESDRRDVATDLLQISRVLSYVSQVLGIGATELYVQETRPLGLLLANTPGTLSLVAGSDLLKGRHYNELTFLAARQLALTRPAYLLATLVPVPAVLRRFVLGAVTLFLPKLAIPDGEQATVRDVNKLLFKQLPTLAKEHLRTLVSSLVSRQVGIDLDDWFFKVQLSVDRAALLLCQDLYYATRLVREAPPLPGAPTADRRIQDLVRYCLSKEYIEIRRLLGMTVGRPK
jgi:hypothetical protein